MGVLGLGPTITTDDICDPKYARILPEFPPLPPARLAPLTCLTFAPPYRLLRADFFISLVTFGVYHTVPSIILSIGTYPQMC